MEALRVIAAATAETGMAGIGSVTLSRRERPVMIEPRGGGIVLITLRAANGVPPAQFDDIGGDIDAEMVEITAAIIERRAGRFDPATFRDRYQDGLRELIDAKLKGRVIKPAAALKSPPVLDLMAALKRSLARESGAAPPKQKSRAAGDRRQGNLLMPVPGKSRSGPTPAAEPRTPTRRRKA